MKKTIRIIGFFVLLLGTVTLMSSCKKDVKNLPGTWKVVTATIDGDDEDDLKDVWMMNSDGTCRIECDFDEYFDDHNFDIVVFKGHYTTTDNKKLTITSEKFNESQDGYYYDRVVYKLDISMLTKKNMVVSGTVERDSQLGNVSGKKSANISLSLTKE